MNIAANRSKRRLRRKLRIKANELARDTQIFAAGCEYDLPMSEDAERLVKTAASVLRFAALLDALKEAEEEDDD